MSRPSPAPPSVGCVRQALRREAARPRPRTRPGAIVERTDPALRPASGGVAVAVGVVETRVAPFRSAPLRVDRPGTESACVVMRNCSILKDSTRNVMSLARPAHRRKSVADSAWREAGLHWRARARARLAAAPCVPHDKDPHENWLADARVALRKDAPRRRAS